MSLQALLRVQSSRFNDFDDGQAKSCCVHMYVDMIHDVSEDEECITFVNAYR